MALIAKHSSSFRHFYLYYLAERLKIGGKVNKSTIDYGRPLELFELL